MPTVLVADDLPHMRELVKTSIDLGGYAVLEAADGETAWALVQTHRPEVVLANVVMPGRTGIELARAIKGDPALAGTHVILLSARAEPSAIRDGLSAGADQYLTKPFSPLKLLQVVEQALALA